MTDIVERLRVDARCIALNKKIASNCLEAADEIKRLRAMYDEAYQSAKAQAALVRSSEARAEELEAETERLRAVLQ